MMEVSPDTWIGTLGGGVPRLTPTRQVESRIAFTRSPARTCPRARAVARLPDAT